MRPTDAVRALSSARAYSRHRRYVRSFISFAVLAFAGCGKTQPTLADRVGVYVWGALPCTADPLVTAADDVRSLGVHAVRICLSPYWDPRPNAADRLAPLYEKVWRTDYQAILRDFPLVMITAYDAASYDARYRSRQQFQSDAAWYAMLRNVQDEFRRFTLELARMPNTYIISNWEAENDATDAEWPDYVSYLQTRLDGIEAGRREAQRLGYGDHVRSAMEFTHVRPGYTYQFDPRPPRAISGLAAALALRGVDYISYSAWESVIHTDDRSYTASKLRDAFAAIRQSCTVKPQGCRLIVGEIGYLRDHDPENWNIRMLLTESLNAGAEIVFNWVAYDQPGQTDGLGFNMDQSEFGKFTLRRQLTPQGTFLERFLQQKGVVFVPTPRRP